MKSIRDRLNTLERAILVNDRRAKAERDRAVAIALSQPIDLVWYAGITDPQGKAAVMAAFRANE